MLAKINIMSNSFPILTFLFLFISLLSAGQDSPEGTLNDLEKYRLKGKVKSVMEIKYALAGSDANKKDREVIYHKLIRFDPNGYEQESILYKNEQEFLIKKYLSGSDGIPFEMNEYLPDGSLNLNVKFTTDNKGNQAEALYSWSENRLIGEICEQTDYYFEILQNEIFTKVTYNYEYRGYCTEQNFFNSDSALSFKLTAKYDFRGNRLESAYFKGNELLSWITKYKYDRYDNMIESSVFKSNRIAVYSKYKYQFDMAGNWISREEKREVTVNIFTAGINPSDMFTERTIEYY